MEFSFYWAPDPLTRVLSRELDHQFADMFQPKRFGNYLRTVQRYGVWDAFWDTRWDALRKPFQPQWRNRPATAPPMRRAVMISSEFDSLPLVRLPSIFLLLPIRKIITSSGTATTPLMTAE